MVNTGKQIFTMNSSDMEEKKEIKSQAVVEVLASGSLKITGNFILKDLKRDTETSPGEVQLCICGKSARKPFCDDSHLK
jgi:hypothetical protein